MKRDPARCRRCNKFLSKVDEALALCANPCQGAERFRLSTLRDDLAERRDRRARFDESSTARVLARTEAAP